MGLNAVQLAGEAFDAAALDPGARALSLHSVRAKDLPRLKGLAALPLTSLELRWISAPDFTAIPLPKTLQTLSILQSPKLRSCAGIEQAQDLRALTWIDSGPLEDAAALARLPRLTALRIEGGMNARQRVASLAFLRGLSLDELVLSGIAPQDLDVTPVLALTGLKRIHVHGPDLAIESLAALAARFPALHTDIAAPRAFPEGMGNLCPNCGARKVMLKLRGRKFLWCPACEATGLGRALDRFAAMVEAARQDGVEALSGVQLAKE